MKKLIVALMLVFIVAVSISAMAAEQRVKFNTPTIVNGTKLAPGEYVIRYDVKDKTAEVKIMQGNKVVLTVTGTVAANEAAQQAAVLRSINPDGSSNLKEIQTGSKKQVINLEGGDTAVGK